MTSALAAAEASGLLPAGRRVIVLLSGGRDSVCLLDVAVRLAGAGAVSAIHVDYGLRPESAVDARHCADIAGRLDVELVVHAAGPAPQTGNLHAWARDVRYGAAAQLALRADARIAAGHTRTDQAETILYRLAASPGRRALLGMPARDGRLIRPLLAVSREDTAAHCRAHGLAWREDASNTDPRFARARVREDLLPALRSLHPAAEENITRTAELLREEAAVLDDVVDTALAGDDAIGVAHLEVLPEALQRLVVRRLAERATGRLCARAAGRLSDILALDEGALDVGDGARAVVSRGRLRFEASEGPARPGGRDGVPVDSPPYA
ncbi:MAG: tRNA lysidine(34) synthetase TilS [Solirubrobacteraceae bacterium]|nr:tRNA lysidine(34) synthetase TilS [Solirubrobacteraceae bacterium]